MRVFIYLHAVTLYGSVLLASNERGNLPLVVFILYSDGPDQQR